MRKILQVVGGSLMVIAAGCPSSVPALCDNGACDGTDGGGDAIADGGADVVQPPAGCDPAAEPKDAPKCVVSDFGVFVDAAGGRDGNPGTKESPVKTIGGALGKLGAKARVYVCEGTYAEHVKLTTAVSIYGGFACTAWSYSGNKAKVAPADAGYALQVGSTSSAMTIADLSFVAPNATDKGQSSIAAFVHGASRVVLVRSTLEAGTAKEGLDGTAGETGTVTAVTGGGALNGTGYPASGTTAGPVKTCTCSSGGTSSGAGGGAPGGSGAPGLPNLSGAAPIDGAGGLGNTSCAAAEPNGTGNNGNDAPAVGDAPKSTALGLLDVTGWAPQGGTAGPSGMPGQGGGGGGGRDATSAGGGGGCGGCGGTGGKPGGGGGASIALLSFNSGIELRSSTLTAKLAGAGGTGGAKGTGAPGGSGASGGPTGCAAGDGGKGADGGTGSGGAGGVAFAVLFKGTAPSNQGSTLTKGTKGAKGAGGTSGTNDGPDGQEGDELEVQ